MKYFMLSSEEEEKEEEKELSEQEFDESVLVGDDRKSLRGLSPEEAAEEIR